jgi:hypothetical protein
MKITVDEHKTGFEVSIFNGVGYKLHCFVFNIKAEVNAFLNGINTCKDIMNGLVQSIPTTYSHKRIE